MSNHVSEPADLHPVDQLAPLLAGELTLAELRAVVLHVRHCPVCQAELVEVAAGYGALQGVAREGLTDLAEPPPLAVHPIDATPVRPLEVVADDPVDAAGSGRGRRSRTPRALTAVAAAAAVVLLISGVLVGTRIGGQETIAAPPTTATTLPPIATVEMIRKGAIEANGTLAMAEVPGTAGAEQVMSVDTSALPPAPDGYFYEVWLLQPETGQMLPVGVLPDGGTASFPLSADLIANYQAVDISQQPDDGSVVHSGDSILRGTYA